MAVGANILMILLTIASLQHRAIALSTSCAMMGNFLFLSVVLYRKLNGYSVSYLLVNLGKILLASAIMWGWLILMRGRLDGWMAGGLLRDITGITMMIGSGALLYGVILYMSGLRELRVLLEKLRKKLRP